MSGTGVTRATSELAGAMRDQIVTQRAVVDRLGRLQRALVDDELDAIHEICAEIMALCREGTALHRRLESCLGAVAERAAGASGARGLAEMVDALPPGEERALLRRLAAELHQELARADAVREQLGGLIAALFSMTHDTIVVLRRLGDWQTGYDGQGGSRPAAPRYRLLDASV